MTKPQVRQLASGGFMVKLHVGTSLKSAVTLRRLAEHVQVQPEFVLTALISSPQNRGELLAIAQASGLPLKSIDVQGARDAMIKHAMTYKGGTKLDPYRRLDGLPYLNWAIPAAAKLDLPIGVEAVVLIDPKKVGPKVHRGSRKLLTAAQQKVLVADVDQELFILKSRIKSARKENTKARGEVVKHIDDMRALEFCSFISGELLDDPENLSRAPKGGDHVTRVKAFRKTLDAYREDAYDMLLLRPQKHRFPTLLSTVSAESLISHLKSMANLVNDAAKHNAVLTPEKWHELNDELRQALRVLQDSRVSDKAFDEVLQHGLEAIASELHDASGDSKAKGVASAKEVMAAISAGDHFSPLASDALKAQSPYASLFRQTAKWRKGIGLSHTVADKVCTIAQGFAPALVSKYLAAGKTGTELTGIYYVLVASAANLSPSSRREFIDAVTAGREETLGSATRRNKLEGRLQKARSFRAGWVGGSVHGLIAIIQLAAIVDTLRKSGEEKLAVEEMASVIGGTIGFSGSVGKLWDLIRARQTMFGKVVGMKALGVIGAVLGVVQGAIAVQKRLDVVDNEGSMLATGSLVGAGISAVGTLVALTAAGGPVGAAIGLVGVAVSVTFEVIQQNRLDDMGGPGKVILAYLLHFERGFKEAAPKGAPAGPALVALESGLLSSERNAAMEAFWDADDAWWTLGKQSTATLAAFGLDKESVKVCTDATVVNLPSSRLFDTGQPIWTRAIDLWLQGKITKVKGHTKFRYVIKYTHPNGKEYTIGTTNGGLAHRFSDQQIIRVGKWRTDGKAYTARIEALHKSDDAAKWRYEVTWRRTSGDFTPDSNPADNLITLDEITKLEVTPA